MWISNFIAISNHVEIYYEMEFFHILSLNDTIFSIYTILRIMTIKGHVYT
jgi:hypothetical protein